MTVQSLFDRPFDRPFDRLFDRPFDRLRDHSGTTQGLPGMTGRPGALSFFFCIFAKTLSL